MFSPRMPAGIRNGMRSSGAFPGNVTVAGTLGVTGNCTLGGNLTLNSASPTITAGNAAGSPVYRFDKDAGGTAQIQLYVESGAANSKLIRHEADETLTFSNWSGSAWDAAITITNTADVDIATSLYLAGAASGDAPAGTDELVIGDGSGAHGMTVFASTTTAGTYGVTDVAGSLRGAWGYDNNTPAHLWLTEGAYNLVLDTAALRPYSPGATDLGNATTPFGKTFATNGARVGNETSLGGTLLSGSGAPGSGIGAVGDLYWRTDGSPPGTPTLYIKTGASTWSSIA